MRVEAILAFASGDAFTAIGLFVAFLALLVSGVSAYFQHFHKRKKLFLNIDYGYDMSYELCFTNAGDHSVVIRGYSVRYVMKSPWTNVEGQFSQSIEVTPTYDPNRAHLKTGDHFPIILKLPETYNFSDIKNRGRKVEEDGRICYEFDIEYSVSFITSEGEEIHRSLPLGIRRFDERGKLCGSSLNKVTTELFAQKETDTSKEKKDYGTVI